MLGATLTAGNSSKHESKVSFSKSHLHSNWGGRTETINQGSVSGIMWW